MVSLISRVRGAGIASSRGGAITRISRTCGTGSSGALNLRRVEHAMTRHAVEHPVARATAGGSDQAWLGPRLRQRHGRAASPSVSRRAPAEIRERGG
jgi:hypothetical protein